MWWIIWLIAAVILGAVEFFTLTVVFGLLAGAAVLAAIAAGLGAPVLIQILVFGVAAGGGMFLVRPIAQRHMAGPPALRDGSDALVGKTALVLRDVEIGGGLIKLAGEEWSARPLDESAVIEAGSLVDVMEIDGATAVVYARDLLA